MGSWIWTFLVAVATTMAVGVSLGTGSADEPGDEPDCNAVLGEEDLMEQVDVANVPAASRTPPPPYQPVSCPQ